MSFSISIITPTYNRKTLVVHSIESSLKFIEQAQSDIELIVIDDASSDGTYEYLTLKYQNELNNGVMKVLQCEKNVGVTQARNYGISTAQGRWLLPLDSDDLIIPEKWRKMLDVIEENAESPIIFFRCIDMSTGKIIGDDQTSRYALPLRKYLNSGTPGECLPVLNTSKFKQILYDPNFRGCEGLTYAKIIETFGPAVVDPLIIRKYGTHNKDRLSAGKGYLQRACYIGKYHRVFLARYLKFLSPATIGKTTIKIVCYWFLCFVFKFDR